MKSVNTLQSAEHPSTLADQTLIPEDQKTRIMRLPEVMRLTGLSRTTIWRLQQTNDFPRQVKLSLRAMGFLSEQVFQWIRARE